MMPPMAFSLSLSFSLSLCLSSNHISPYISGAHPQTLSACNSHPPHTHRRTSSSLNEKECKQRDPVNQSTRILQRQSPRSPSTWCALQARVYINTLGTKTHKNIHTYTHYRHQCTNMRKLISGIWGLLFCTKWTQKWLHATPFAPSLSLSLSLCRSWFRTTLTCFGAFYKVNVEGLNRWKMDCHEWKPMNTYLSCQSSTKCGVLTS